MKPKPDGSSPSSSLSPPAVHGAAAQQPASVHLRLRLGRPAVGHHHAQRGPAHHADHPLHRLLQEHVHAAGEQRLGDGGLLRGRPGGLAASSFSIATFKHRALVVFIPSVISRQKVCVQSVSLGLTCSLIFNPAAPQSRPPRHRTSYPLQVPPTGKSFSSSDFVFVFPGSATKESLSPDYLSETLRLSSPC